VVRCFVRRKYRRFEYRHSQPLTLRGAIIIKSVTRRFARFADPISSTVLIVATERIPLVMAIDTRALRIVAL
jgi:hypothetical protein